MVVIFFLLLLCFIVCFCESRQLDEVVYCEYCQEDTGLKRRDLIMYDYPLNDLFCKNCKRHV